MEAHVFFKPLQRSYASQSCNPNARPAATSTSPRPSGTQRTVDSGPTGEVQNYDGCATCCTVGSLGDKARWLWAHCRFHLLSVKLWTVNVGQWAHCQGHSHQGSSSGAVSSHSAQSSRMKEATTQRFSVRMLKSPAPSTCTPTRPLIFTSRVTRP